MSSSSSEVVANLLGKNFDKSKNSPDWICFMQAAGIRLFLITLVKMAIMLLAMLVFSQNYAHFSKLCLFGLQNAWLYLEETQTK
jgi:hypothetical protein